MAQSRVPLRQQVVGLVVPGWTEPGECGKKQHAAKIYGSTRKSVIGFTHLHS
jgi:hypothetical protein